MLIKAENGKQAKRVRLKLIFFVVQEFDGYSIISYDSC